MINLIAGGALVISGLLAGLFAYRFAFKMGANTVWRAVDIEGSRPELFGGVEPQDILPSTEDMDQEIPGE